MSVPMPIRDPAPHRGFNTKAREVLLDSPKGQFRISSEKWERVRTQVCTSSMMRRSESDEEFLRRVGLIRFHRADSEESASGSSTPEKKKLIENKEEFDGIDDLPKLEKKMIKMKIRTLGEIGKTRSVGELHKKPKASKTFQQMNIVKLPSAESDEQPTAKQLPIASTLDPKRTAQYEMR